MLAPGTPAPLFTLPDQNGEPRSLADFRGQKVILYFYPRDMTSGCTRQACGFAELYPHFREQGAVVLGVSRLVREEIDKEEAGLEPVITHTGNDEVQQSLDDLDALDTNGFSEQ